jgi:hypothetical protein
MSKMNCRGARPGPRLALPFCFLGLSLILPTTVFAGGPTIWVAPPNGVNDTANIQAALNACVAQGPGCSVQLQAGHYFTRQLVTYNFRGTFKGMGIGSTTIEALHPLLVNVPDLSVGECTPNTTTCLWPTLIIFVDGNTHVSDLSIRITAPPGTATTGLFLFGFELTDLIDALRFMGSNPTHAVVDRISVEGLPDDSPTSSGFNLINGVSFLGEFPRALSPFDYYFLSGSLTVRNSSFKSMDDGVGVGSFLTSSQITLGGSPSTGNSFENVYAGMDMESAENSDFEISYNVSSGIVAGMWVIPWMPVGLSVFIPSSPSRYAIHDNKFIGTGQNAEGFYFMNEPGHPWIHAAAWNNIVELQGPLSEGIGAFNTSATAILNNSVTGTDGFDAVGLHNSTLSTVIHNNVSGFTVDSSVGLAQIFLDSSSTNDLVVCSNPNDTALNLGTDNLVIGCGQVTATWSTDPANTLLRPNLPKGKPILH